MNDERRTPRWLFDALNKQFAFTVDAASTDENALVSRHWTKADNGLAQDWSGHSVWCNPPYSRGQLIQWVHKAIGNQAVLLVPGDCSTVASQLALENATRILFLNKRLAFDNEKSGAKFCNWVVVFGSTRYRARMMLESLNLGAVL